MTMKKTKNSIVPKNVNNIDYVSASRCNTYNTCKFQLFKTVIEGGHDQYAEDYEESFEDAVYLMFGKAVHKTLETFHKEKFRKRAELRQLFRDNFIDYGLTDSEYHTLGLTMCDTHFEYIKNYAPKRLLVATELFFRIKLGVDRYGNDAYAQGTIDAVWYHGNGLYEIVDYKTSNWLPSQDELEANTQIALYDIALRAPEMKEHWYKGIEPKAILLTMEYLRFEDGLLQTEIDDETREGNIMYYIDIYTQMKYKKPEFFIPTLNNLCYFCECNRECPKYQMLLEGNTDEIVDLSFDENDFADSIRAIETYKGCIKSLERELNDLNCECEEYIKNNDVDVIVDGRQYFLSNYSKRYLIPVTTIKILKNHGLWDEKEFITSVPLGKVEALCKDHPDVWQEIENKTLRRSHGKASLKSKAIPKGTLFLENKRKK